jgi:hypothetical protein
VREEAIVEEGAAMSGTENIARQARAKLDELRTEKAACEARGDLKCAQRFDPKIRLWERTLAQIERVGISYETGGFTRSRQYAAPAPRKRKRKGKLT